MEESVFAQDFSGFRKFTKMEGGGGGAGREREGRSAEEFAYPVTHKPHSSFRKELVCPSYRWGNLLLQVLDNLPKKYDS